MALAAATVWEVRTAGSDTLCSGGFVAGAAGTDYSQQDAAQYTGTNLVIDGATNTKVTSATHNFVAADVGNLIQVTAGSGFTVGFYQIVSVASNAATCDRSFGTLGSTGGTFAVGGALLSPGIACSVAIGQNTVWVKSGTYTVSSTSNNVALGRITPAASVVVRGYGTTRGDDAARPVLQASGIATVVMVTLSASTIVWNIGVDGASLTSTQGFALTSADARALYCSAINCTNNGYTSNNFDNLVVRCYATGCSTQPAFNVRQAFYCEAKANTAGGFAIPINWMAVGCLAYGNTTYGFNLASTSSHAVGCTAYNNSTSGFIINSATAMGLVNCLAYGNGTYGFDLGGTTSTPVLMVNCAGGANTTANRNGGPPTLADNFVTLTADPFVNAAGGNFALNSTAGGGAAIRALALPGVFPAGTTTSYLDIGAAQHQDSGGGTGGTGPNVIVSSGASSRGGSW